MPKISRKSKGIRVTREALDKAREQIKAEAAKPKVDREKEAHNRHIDRWITLPEGKASYPGESAYVDNYQYVWADRLDPSSVEYTDDGKGKTVHFRPYCLGKLDALYPKPETVSPEKSDKPSGMPFAAPVSPVQPRMEL